MEDNFDKPLNQENIQPNQENMQQEGLPDIQQPIHSGEQPDIQEKSNNFFKNKKFLGMFFIFLLIIGVLVYYFMFREDKISPEEFKKELQNRTTAESIIDLFEEVGLYEFMLENHRIGCRSSIMSYEEEGLTYDEFDFSENSNFLPEFNEYVSQRSGNVENIEEFLTVFTNSIVDDILTLLIEGWREDGTIDINSELEEDLLIIMKQDHLDICLGNKRLTDIVEDLVFEELDDSDDLLSDYRL